MRSTERTQTTPPIPLERQPAATPDRPDPIDLGLLGAQCDHPWELTPTVHARVADPLARQISWTREAMIEPYARDAFVLSPDPTGLDLDCGEGRLLHRMLAWGARSSLGLCRSVEAQRRAILLRSHFAIRPEALDLRVAADVVVEALGRHDVVIVGMGAGREGRIADAEATCRGIAIIECPDPEADAAAAEALKAGFAVVDRVAPPLHAAAPFLLGDREVLVAYAPEFDPRGERR